KRQFFDNRLSRIWKSKISIAGIEVNSAHTNTYRFHPFELRSGCRGHDIRKSRRATHAENSDESRIGKQLFQPQLPPGPQKQPPKVDVMHARAHRCFYHFQIELMAGAIDDNGMSGEKGTEFRGIASISEPVRYT